MLRLAAHDYWFEPSPRFAAPGAVVDFRLFVGQNLQPEEEREYQRLRAERIELAGPDGGRALRDRLAEGAKPFATAELASPGLHLLVLERAPSLITLEADKFADYLREEGLQSILAQREQRGEARQPGRERYRRSLKACVWVGDRAGPLPATTLRLDLAPRFAADRRPAVGDTLPVRVTFEHTPLAGATLAAVCRDPAGEVHRQQVVTDARGEASLTLDRAGLWVLKLVHMRRAPAGDAEADWESFWAACTFGLK